MGYLTSGNQRGCSLDAMNSVTQMIQSIPVNLKALAINYIIFVETNEALGKFGSVFTRFPDNLVSVVRHQNMHRIKTWNLQCPQIFHLLFKSLCKRILHSLVHPYFCKTRVTLLFIINKCKCTGHFRRCVTDGDLRHSGFV